MQQPPNPQPDYLPSHHHHHWTQQCWHIAPTPLPDAQCPWGCVCVSVSVVVCAHVCVFDFLPSNSAKSLRTESMDHVLLCFSWIPHCFPEKNLTQNKRLALNMRFKHALNMHTCVHVCAQSCPALCHPMDCSLPSSSVCGIFQARMLEWVAISFSRICD